MHELSVDSDVTFRKVLGSAEILPTRPGIDPFEETRPMDTSSGTSIAAAYANNFYKSVCYCALCGTWAGFLTPHHRPRNFTIASVFGVEKLELRGYPTVKRNLIC